MEGDELCGMEGDESHMLAAGLCTGIVGSMEKAVY